MKDLTMNATKNQQAIADKGAGYDTPDKKTAVKQIGRSVKQALRPAMRNKRILTPEERALYVKKAEIIRNGLASHSWRDLEAHRKFDRNEKLGMMDSNVLIVGCDIGSEKHYARAYDDRGAELSARAFPIDNDKEGYESFMDWALEIAAMNDKSQIVVGIEPTGHYWFCFYEWLTASGVTVVQVNPYAVKRIKEVDDNSQLKSDQKDPSVIAKLVKDGSYGLPYLPEEVYADLRNLSLLRTQLIEDRTRAVNRLHRDMAIYFPEYKDVFGKNLDGKFALALLAEAQTPADFISLGVDGIKEIWHRHKLRGRAYDWASKLVKLGTDTVGLKEGVDSIKRSIKHFAEEAAYLDGEIEDVEALIEQAVQKIENYDKVKAIAGMGDVNLPSIIADMGDLSRFDDPKELQKIAGLSIVSISSGKHNGESRISKRGRKRLRYWLYQAAMSLVAHNEAFRELHLYYTTREDNPLSKKQSLTVLGCKLIRILYKMLTTGAVFDPEQVVSGVRKRKADLKAAA